MSLIKTVAFDATMVENEALIRGYVRAYYPNEPDGISGIVRWAIQYLLQHRQDNREMLRELYEQYIADSVTTEKRDCTVTMKDGYQETVNTIGSWLVENDIVKKKAKAKSGFNFRLIVVLALAFAADMIRRDFPDIKPVPPSFRQKAT
jgi:hypothetical protein